jgi:hypothetical protein
LKELFDLSETVNYHPAYENIALEKSSLAIEAKSFFQKLYNKYVELNYEENNFLDGIKKQWHPRVWELYFTIKLMELGFDINCPKGNAPDVKIQNDNQIIWIECATLSKGNGAVKECDDDVLHTFNDEDYILRITSTITSKYKQIENHRESGVIGSEDIVLIAMNTGELDLTEIAQMDFPLIQKALYGIGSMTYNFTTKEVSNQHRLNVKKSNNVKIKTNYFATDEYENISGIIFSDWKSTEISKKLTEGFELTHNLYAKNKLREGFFKIGCEYMPYINDNLGEFKKLAY